MKLFEKRLFLYILFYILEHSASKSIRYEEGKRRKYNSITALVEHSSLRNVLLKERGMSIVGEAYFF